MSKSQVVRAMGSREGDYLELHNQWAKVVVEREDNGNGLIEFVVTGDLEDLRAHRKVFTTATAAMAYALASLESYEKGAFR